MFPNISNKFPTKLRPLNSEYSLAIALALKEDVGDSRSSIKTLRRWTGASERTVQNWLSGIRGPSAPDLIALSQNSAQVFLAVVVLAGRSQPRHDHAEAALALMLEAVSLLQNRH